ncbi:ABC transporter ATP-binding protein [Clostridium luticellarii]|jgi:iron complex transport system ATP-binding protein|uniref:Putative ABC transporter ATP-binding protein n=1 Tax=Clostridium luticellarii TaxID=1691940 RepID=A0A2T0B7G8_9CLOT|nr:ABC transporter ATP-binding protein [Clostridium luticellarii]MCI1944002.1 ABC transporter ATP-binding protein [Clostridium luticellarii]MCI1967356.1 ABC transporter ATP-binding protein [Clostridium luticellarii]MCI1995547.1 ABC transporter ATP-binding protein [Clostridium luticellarii]MCI2039158.1 ABC transporter ATP-binding protein [Clostridium luticellarii]PRR79834.1 putative ABC transporter ATP-binding protein [Clostridium luticellarii]
MIMDIKNVSCGYGSKIIVKNISLGVKSGEILCILGPNGVGKTTFFKSILGFLKLKSGEILIDNENIQSWSRKKLAMTMGYVPQSHTTPFPFTVIDVVVMGRTSHLGITASPTKRDVKIAENNMAMLGISYLKDKIYTEISGGEKQMVLIARALTQEPDLLIMDEPTSNLDFGNQVRVLRQISRLAKKGLAIIMTSHFPDHAFLCSTQVALFQKHNNFIIGNPDDIVTEKNLKMAYGINVKIITTNLNDGSEIKSCIPLLEN